MRLFFRGALKVARVLQDNAGSSIFLLLKAIKQQVSKGPLDAITGKVRYTLNDDCLLKEDIEFETLVSHPRLNRRLNISDFAIFLRVCSQLTL